MVGYLSFLKIGPKLLRLVPGDKARDLRNWLTVYSFWNQASSPCAHLPPSALLPTQPRPRRGAA